MTIPAKPSSSESQAEKFRDLARQTQQKAASPTPAQVPASSRAATPTSAAHSRTDSGTARADEGFWVAVLPFKAQGVSPDLAALADRLERFEDRYNQTARPFDWRFTRNDLAAMMQRLDAHRAEPDATLAA